MNLKAELENLGVQVESDGRAMANGDSLVVYLKDCHQITWDQGCPLDQVAKHIAEKSKHIQPWPLLLPKGMEKAEIQDWDGIPIRHIDGNAPGSDTSVKRYDIAFRALDAKSEAA